MSSFNGIAFPGSQAGNITYFSLNPSCVLPALCGRSTFAAKCTGMRSLFLAARICRQVTTSIQCSVNATCVNGGCRCNTGFYGDGFTCTGTRQASCVHLRAGGLQTHHGGCSGARTYLSVQRARSITLAGPTLPATAARRAVQTATRAMCSGATNASVRLSISPATNVRGWPGC